MAQCLDSLPPTNTCCCGISLRTGIRLVGVGIVLLSVLGIVESFVILEDEKDHDAERRQALGLHANRLRRDEMEEEEFHDEDESTLPLIILSVLRLLIALMGCYAGCACTDTSNVKARRVTLSSVLLWIILISAILDIVDLLLVLLEEHLTNAAIMLELMWEGGYIAICLYFAYVAHSYNYGLRHDLPVDTSVVPMTTGPWFQGQSPVLQTQVQVATPTAGAGDFRNGWFTQAPVQNTALHPASQSSHASAGEVSGKPPRARRSSIGARLK